MSAVIVQCVHVTWTKASRGGNGARLRASLLRPAPLPTGSAAEVVLQSIRHAEWEAFAPVQTVSTGTLREALTQIPPAELASPRETSTMRRALWDRGLALWESDDGRLDIHAVPESRECDGDGAHLAPRRRWRRAVLLERGKWGRLRINARRVGDWNGVWSYQETMTSIAWHIDAPANLFLGDPHAVFDDRARLR
jgi:hypothetical protein